MIERRVLLDTGPLVALLAENDAYHHLCVNTMATVPAPLLTCWPVLTEAAWLLRRYPHPADRLNDALSAGVFDILPFHVEDLPAIAAFMHRYEDTGLQFADAALAHLAEREGISTLFTTDRRDFSIIRLKRDRSLKPIPAVQ